MSEVKSSFPKNVQRVLLAHKFSFSKDDGEIEEWWGPECPDTETRLPAPTDRRFSACEFDRHVQNLALKPDPETGKSRWCIRFWKTIEIPAGMKA